MANRSMVSPSRGKQGCVYNRSFDEVHRQFENSTDHKGLYRRNLDEIGKNFGQIVQNQNPTSSSSSSASYFAGNLNLKGTTTTMSKKNMDEMWNEYDNMVEQEHNVLTKQNQDIVNDAQLMAIDPMVMASHMQQGDWLQMQMQMQIPGVGGINYQNLSFRKSESEMPLMEIYPMTSSSESQAEAGAMERKRQYSEERLEKSIERRQKRMIKNRESAARSRARKQEYTKNLEDRKNQLEQTNGWLKKIKAVETQSKVNTRYQLRRTSSASF